MKRISAPFILACFLIVLLLGAALKQPGTVQSSFYGITMTPTLDIPTETPIPPTETPVPTETMLPTETALPTDLPTPTPTPEDDDDDDEGSDMIPGENPILPNSGQGRPGLSEFLSDYSVMPLLNYSSPGLKLPVDQTRIRRLAIPKIGVDSRVASVAYNGETWDISQYQDTVAWLEETNLPGEGKNTVLTAHVSSGVSLTPIFMRLKELQPGDRVRLETSWGEYIYQVREQKVVSPADLSILAASSTPQVTLLTCTGWNEDLQQFLLRRVIIADLVEVIVDYPTRSNLVKMQ